jgi:toxin ParE1/3/4
VPAYRLSFAASDDILHIFLEGLDRFGPPQADEYHEGLASAFGFLAEYPRAARLRDEIDPPVRVHRYKSHMIVYDIGEDDTVLILRVRHGREDWQAPNAEE